MLSSNSDLFRARAVETRGRFDRLVADEYHWHPLLMSDVVPITAWLTYQQVAERLGLRSASAAASRARRGKWPRRTRNDTLETEVCVPPDVLAAGPQKPRERREPAAPAADAVALGDAV